MGFLAFGAILIIMGWTIQKNATPVHQALVAA
jgi:hypothetical protein